MRGRDKRRRRRASKRFPKKRLTKGRRNPLKLGPDAQADILSMGLGAVLGRLLLRDPIKKTLDHDGTTIDSDPIGGVQ